MSEIEHAGMCPIHGPGHLGKPCPSESGVEEEESVENDYESFEELFAVENLREHFAEVKVQLDALADLIYEFEKVSLQHKTDQDADHYVDEAAEKVEHALKNFTINGKKIDLSNISSQTTYKEIYNDIVFDVNTYIEFYMIGMGQKELKSI